MTTSTTLGQSEDAQRKARALREIEDDRALVKVRVERERVGREERERLRREQELEAASAETEMIAESDEGRAVEMEGPPLPVTTMLPESFTESFTTRDVSRSNVARGDKVRKEEKVRKGHRAHKGQEQDEEELPRFSGAGHILGGSEDVEGGEDP